ncbi:MAG: hypothetical protein ACRC9T_09570 [Vibrionaceae bacterium]
MESGFGEPDEEEVLASAEPSLLAAWAAASLVCGISFELETELIPIFFVFLSPPSGAPAAVTGFEPVGRMVI